MKAKVLFLCTGNSCRSQMSEGWARHLLRDSFDPFSAGTDPHPMNQRAVKAMKEVGVDISDQHPKSFKDLKSVAFDLVVTVCDNAANSCPIPPDRTAIIHVPFDDPPRLAKDAASEEEAMQHYRRVRDEIKEFILTLPLKWSEFK